jgi:hypothetical protein
MQPELFFYPYSDTVSTKIAAAAAAASTIVGALSIAVLAFVG